MAASAVEDVDAEQWGRRAARTVIWKMGPSWCGEGAIEVSCSPAGLKGARLRVCQGTRACGAGAGDRYGLWRGAGGGGTAQEEGPKMPKDNEGNEERGEGRAGKGAERRLTVEVEGEEVTCRSRKVVGAFRRANGRASPQASLRAR